MLAVEEMVSVTTAHMGEAKDGAPENALLLLYGRNANYSGVPEASGAKYSEVNAIEFHQKCSSARPVGNFVFSTVRALEYVRVLTLQGVRREARKLRMLFPAWRSLAPELDLQSKSQSQSQGPTIRRYCMVMKKCSSVFSY